MAGEVNKLEQISGIFSQFSEENKDKLLAMILVACIVPLFFPGGRRLIKKAFGIW